MHSVKDGQRTLTFDGDLLASSSSQRVGNPRWVEFVLYRTKGGQYVLGRTGHSLCYHVPGCGVVSRNNIEPQPLSELTPDAVPCQECRPTYSTGSDTLVCPEQQRHWAQTSETAEGVVMSLYKYDDNSTRYLTYVAKRLLQQASELDPQIRDIFFNEHVA